MHKTSNRRKTSSKNMTYLINPFSTGLWVVVCALYISDNQRSRRLILRWSDIKYCKNAQVRPMTLIFWQKTLNSILLKVRKNEKDIFKPFWDIKKMLRAWYIVPPSPPRYGKGWDWRSFVRIPVSNTTYQSMYFVSITNCNI